MGIRGTRYIVIRSLVQLNTLGMVFLGILILNLQIGESLAAPPAKKGSVANSKKAGGSLNPKSSVSQEQFNEMLRLLKKSTDQQIESLERKLALISQGSGASQERKSPPSQQKEQEVDLNHLSSAPAGGANIPKADPSGIPIDTQSSVNPHGKVSAVQPGFRVYFDLNLVNRPGISDFSFENYHAFLFYEILPSPHIQFAFDVSPAPKYYELDYNFTPKIQFRAGKIWIPFDDLSPHNIFGGRINTSKLSPSKLGTAAFLPDIWTDLGVGLNIKFMDTSKILTQASIYVVNGFGDGGKDPTAATGVSAAYPTFADIGVGSSDNNRNKAIGGRFHILALNTLGAGLSFYNGRWSRESDESLGVSMLGFDTQLRYPRTELRLGLAFMNVALPGGVTFNRGGYYGELGYKIGVEKRWKILARAGAVQLDNRVSAVTDQNIVGGTILYLPEMVQYSLEHSRDLNTSMAKANKVYTAFRVIVAL